MMVTGLKMGAHTQTHMHSRGGPKQLIRFGGQPARDNSTLEKVASRGNLIPAAAGNGIAFHQ